MKTDSTLTCRSRLVAACAIGLAVWALRVALIGDLGTGIPWMDQWDREGLFIYEPWVQGQLSWGAIFEPYLEHRIAWTNLWNIGLFELCGQWDPMVQIVAQAVIPALTAGFCVWGLVVAHSGRLWRSAVLAGALMAFGAPFAYQNILWGFQSSFALYVLLSLGGCAAAALAWGNPQYGGLALLAGLAAPLAMGAGALVGPIIFALTILVMLAEKKVTRRSRGMLLVGLVCLGWGLALRSTSTAMNFTHARSLSEFGKVWLAACAWPNSRFPWMAGLACLPVGLLIVQVVRKASSPRSHELFIVGVFLWATASAAAGAWARGALGSIPPSRYCDFLTVLCWVNLLALFSVLRAWREQGKVRWRAPGVLITMAWLGSVIYGGIGMMEHFVKIDRPDWQKSATQQFEEANSTLVGLSTAVSVREKSGRQPKNYEKVFESQVLAPFLPPEIRLPIKGVAPDDTLAVGRADAEPAWEWQSGCFASRTSAMIMFVRGDAAKLDLALLNQSGEAKAEFQPWGRHIGGWSEWLVRPPLGQYRLSIRAASASGGFAVILPKPLSAAGYWARCVSAEQARLVELAGICLAVALLVCQAKERSDKGTPKSVEADA